MKAVNEKAFKKIIETFGSNAEMTNLKLLQQNQVDLVICEVSVCQYLIKMHPRDFGGIDFSPRVIGEVMPLHLAISKKWPGAEQLTKDFNSALARLVASGTRRKIFDKYGISTDLK